MARIDGSNCDLYRMKNKNDENDTRHWVIIQCCETCKHEKSCSIYDKARGIVTHHQEKDEYWK